jgi:pimeloyl-ACP methyl ester carboxylesterase
MLKSVITFLIGLLSFALQAQQIGHTTITFADASRTGGFGSGGGTGRQIQTEIYYNAATAGTDVPMVLVGGKTAGTIVFGHGFAMAWDSYSWLWDSLTALGYIIALPRTESNIFPNPNHADFGADLKWVAAKMLEQNAITTSIFNNKLNNKIAIGGHSMGGGCSFIAGASNNNITCIFNFAAAETNGTSAISSASNITVPSLVFAGGSDCVAPTATNSKKMYDNISNAVCKYYININDAMHCQFNDANFTCNAGQISCPTSVLSREAQLSKVLRHLLPFLNYQLLNDASAITTFENNYANASDVIKEKSCAPLALNNVFQTGTMSFWPNPTNGIVHFKNTLFVAITNFQGNVVFSQLVNQLNTINISALPSGTYFIKMFNMNGVKNSKILKL